MCYLLFSFYIKRKKRKKHYQKIIKNGWNRLRTRAKSVGGWKNDNRVERHDRGQKKKGRGWSKRKPCGEYSQLLSASNKRGEGRGEDEEQLELFQWFIFIDWNPPFLILFHCYSCVLSDCVPAYTIKIEKFRFAQPLTFSRGRKISQRIFDPSTLRARWSLIAVIDQFSNDL